MLVKFYGTRGSIPVNSAGQIENGGNTTCLRIKSRCIPGDEALVVDAGNGIVPLGRELVKEGVKLVRIFMTHYHHDHTLGLVMTPTTHFQTVQTHLIGPCELGYGPREMLRHIMKKPFFPRESAEVEDTFEFTQVDVPQTSVFLFHPSGGMRHVGIEEFRRAEKSTGQIDFGSTAGILSIGECLVITMMRSNHPEYTFTYRFEERPTGKIFVFLTDCENADQPSQTLLDHASNADLLVMDSQYTREAYDEFFGGYGHGTPDFCVRIACEARARVLGLTHHDPFASDEDISNIFAHAQEALRQKQEAYASVGSGEDAPTPDLLLCRDYLEVEVGAPVPA